MGKVVAKETVFVAGMRQPIQRGRLYDEDDSVVRSRPELFEPAEEHARREQRPVSTADLGHRSMSGRHVASAPTVPVEQATAAPGELRNVTRPDPDADEVSGEEQREDSDPLACDVDGCDFVAKSPAGLGKHRRSHDA